MSRSGARQWRLPCPHLDGRPAERAMHSEVSQNNVRFFPKEDRVTSDVSQADLEDWLEQADHQSGSLVACNQCRRVKIVVDGDIDVVHEGGLRA